MTAALSALDVYKRFGSGQRATAILKGVTLEIKRGEIAYLVGPSGSGKTTLLSILGCILTPDQGLVEVLGKEISQLKTKELTAFRCDYLGFIFQNFHLFPTLTVLDNVCLALTMKQVPLRRAISRARELLDLVGLAGRQHYYPSRLSTGECQRVAIARALAHDPEILFADEPTASLDADNGQRIMELLCGCVQARGMTLVVVTHDNRIFPFSDRIFKLEDGHILAEPAFLSGRATIPSSRFDIAL